MSDDTKKKLIIGVALLLIVLIMVFVYFNSHKNNYYKIKKNKDNYLVYSRIEKDRGANSIYVPYLNIDSEASDAVNADIEAITNEYIEKGNCYITYEYDISGIILSLVLKIKEYNNKGLPDMFFKTYNISLETLELISDESLLDFYDVDTSTVEAVMENKFREHYDNLVNDTYYDPNECDYECFLAYRCFDNYLDDVSYYVENGNLIVFKPFNIFSFFGEEDYFKEDDFKFVIVKES